MDFPNDVKTNVYKLDNVKEIYWYFFARRQNEKGKIQESMLGEQEQDLTCGTQATQCTLLDQGCHTLLDEHNTGLWIFCLSEANKEKALQILDSDNFECHDQGCINAIDLGSASGQSTTAPRSTNAQSPSAERPFGGVSEINAQTFNPNKYTAMRPPMKSLDEVKGCLTDAGHKYAMPEIYGKLILALSQSMIYALSKGGLCLPIGISSCITRRTLGDNVFKCLESSPITKRSSFITCDVRWVASGSMLFFFSDWSGPRLCTLFHALFSNGTSFSLDHEDAVLLSPSGLIGHYYSIERTPKNHSSYASLMAQKSRVSACLVRNGAPMPDNPQWVYIILDVDIVRAELEELIEGAGDTALTLWPAHLCLCKDGSSCVPLSEDVNPIEASHVSTDPLERVEAWFLAKNARLDALEYKRRMEVADAEKTNDTPDLDNGDASVDQQQLSQQVTPRDVSGIYPTPPDGLPSATHESSMGDDHQANGVVGDLGTATMGQGLNRSYDQHRGDTLFEEMDIDMFATNGLTEDDFSFFDEPKGDDPHGPASGDGHYAFELPMQASPPAELSDLLLRERHDGDTSPQAYSDSKDSHQSAEPLTKQSPSSGEIPERNITYKEERRATEDLISEEEAGKTPLLDLYPLSTEPEQHKETSFNTVPFPSFPSDFDSKYRPEGRYGFDFYDPAGASELQEISKQSSQSLPTMGIIRTERSIEDNDSSLADSMDEQLSIGSSLSSPNRRDKEVGQETYQQTGRKRKRDPSEDQDHLATPRSSTALTDIPEQLEHQRFVNERALLFPSKSRHTGDLLKLSTNPGGETKLVGSDRTFVQVAQLVADQAISSMSASAVALERCPGQCPAEMTQIRRLIEVAIDIFSSKSDKAIKRLTLKDFIGFDDQDQINAVRDQSSVLQKAPKPPYPNRASLAALQMVSKLPIPDACLQRSGSLIDIAPSALRFWEELSLAPSHDVKDIIAFCVFPAERNVQAEIITFLDIIKGTYQSCKLGLHSLGPDIAKQVNTLVPIPMGQGNLGDAQSEGYRACENFGLSLGKMKLEGSNTLVYMVNPTNNEASLPSLCAAFLALSNAYISEVKRSNVDTPNDLVLQIIPSNLIYSETEIPLPSPVEYRKLAFEVYDRCAPKQDNHQKSKWPFICTPSLRLAKAVPKTIDFRLTPENPVLSLQSDNCLHVAYTWSIGNGWLTASWTDNLGVLSWTACYPFVDASEATWPPFPQIANEIWETTLDMLQSRSGPWRILLCKDGPVYKHEMEAWQSVVMASSKPPLKFPVLFTFLTIVADPLLDFPNVERDMERLDLPRGSLETPVSTPQTSVPSPDVSSINSAQGGAMQMSSPPPSTAFGDHDTEARLIDFTDETWGVLMSRSVDDGCVPSDYCSALASGYLVKRRSPREEDGLLRIGVNIIRGQKPHRPLLKAVLGMYSNLALLARVRGIADPAQSVDPYHIAAVKKAYTAVSAAMCYRTQ